jgi:hypothetical protein
MLPYLLEFDYCKHVLVKILKRCAGKCAIVIKYLHAVKQGRGCFYVVYTVFHILMYLYLKWNKLLKLKIEVSSLNLFIIGGGNHHHPPGPLEAAQILTVGRVHRRRHRQLEMSKKISKYFLGGFLFFSFYIQHCFICHPTDSTVPTEAGIEPRTVATGAVRRSNH